MEPSQIQRIIEAALLAAPHPLTVPQLAALFDEFDMPTPEHLAKAILALQEACAGRGVELVEVASGYRYQVCRDVHAHVSRLWAEKPARYSRALLETLALIAYRQPITRAEIEAIRGVAVSTNIVRTLEEREWVRVVGHRDLPGKPALLGTTRQFLDYFNLKSLDELPTLGTIHDLEEVEQQLAFAEGDVFATASIASTDDDGDEEDVPACGAADDDIHATSAGAPADPANDAAHERAPTSDSPETTA